MTLIRRETFFLLVGDLALLVFSLWLALAIRVLHVPTVSHFLLNVTAFIPVFLISIVVFFIAGLYEKQTLLIKRIMSSRILGAQISNTILAAILFFVLPLVIAPKTILILYLIISVFLIQMWRFYITPHLAVSSRQLAILVGHGESVSDVFNEVNGNNRYRIRFVNFIDTENRKPKDVSKEILEGIREGVRTVILDTRDSGVREQLPALYGPMVQGVSFVEFVEFYENLYDRVPLSHIDYAWLLACLPTRHLMYDFGKRAFDLVGASVGIVIAVPFVLVASIFLRIENKEVFIYHERVGERGKNFKMIKLRTMLFNDHGDPELQKQNRVTSVGRFLRKSRIDELPQLLNVFKGELSFIGPRPEFPTMAAIYSEEIPYYGIRHVIKPGLSGWAQISDYDAPRGAADIERTRRKLSYDLYYLKQRSFILDMLIVLKTFRALAAFSGK